MTDQANNNPPVAGAAERAAMMRLFLRLGDAVMESFLTRHPELMRDADVSMLTRLTGAVILGQSEGKPFTAHKLAQFTGLDPATVKRKLDKMVKVGSLVTDGKHYFMEPSRAVVLAPEIEERFCRTLYDALKALQPFLHLHPNYGVSIQFED